MISIRSSRRTKAWRDRAIPRRPLLWLAAALLFTLPPMFGNLASWVPFLFLFALLLKFWMEPRGYRLRSFILNVVLAVLTVGAIFLSYDTLKGIEPSVSLLAVLVSLKILEAHTAREFQVMVMMAWVLCLCGFLLSQDLAMAVCLFVAFALLIAALIQFHRGSSPGAFWRPLTTTFKLLAQAAPLVVLLFLLFPRILFNAGFRLRLGDFRPAVAGFSDRLAPGGIVSLANSSEIAFRAEFPDRRTGPPGPMYWRGVVMWHCEGLEWRAPYSPASISDSSRPSPTSDKAIRQRITIAPHGARWMFALDRPFGSPSGAMLARGNYLSSLQPIRKVRRYEVLSSIEPIRKELDVDERRQALQLPASISPAVRELASSFAESDPHPRAIVNSALQFFRTQGFRYSLAPGEYNKNDLEEFLFRRRTGFCEHYAASFATLMRLAGIPARIVEGYLGGEYNDLGGFFLVRQADTHAWCEVWIPENGWTRIDPTSVVAPGRASQDLSSFLAGRVASREMATGERAFLTRLARLALVNQVRFAWEALNYQWDTRVMGFDADVQDVLLTSLGLTNRGTLPLVIQVLVIIAAVLIIYACWMQLRTRPRGDRIQALYERYCEKLARIGVQRDPWEGPSDFAARTAQSVPNESKRVRQITEMYIALRYAPRPAATNLHEFAKEVSAFTIHRQ